MFNGKLYEKQKPGAGFLVNKRKVLFAWEQGCGKTVISLAAACKLFEIGKAKTCLIIAPSGLTWQWMDKIYEFTDSEVLLAEASNSNSRTYEPIARGFNVVGYHLFRNDFDVINQHAYDIVIADEAQEFRSTKSVTRKLILANNRKHNPDYRWALTGTAISKEYENLYSIMYWVDKTFLPPWPDFEKNHIRRRFKNGPIYKYVNIKQLSKHLENRVSRMELEDLSDDVPDLIEKLITIPRSKDYERAEENLLIQLERMVETGKVSQAQIRKAFAKVRATFWTKDRQLSMVRSIHALLKENKRNKLIVFSKEKAPLKALQKALQETGTEAATYTGDERLSEKQDAAIQLNNGFVRVLLASNAGYKGLDIPSLTHVLHADVPPSWEILDQRNKRARRLTSTHKHTLVTYFAFEYSLELYYLNLVKLVGEAAHAAYHGTQDEIVVKPESLRQFLRMDDEERARTIRNTDLTAIRT